MVRHQSNLAITHNRCHLQWFKRSHPCGCSPETYSLSKKYFGLNRVGKCGTDQFQHYISSTHDGKASDQDKDHWQTGHKLVNQKLEDDHHLWSWWHWLSQSKHFSRPIRRSSRDLGNLCLVDPFCSEELTGAKQYLHNIKMPDGIPLKS